MTKKEGIMKKLALLFVVLLLAGCATTVKTPPKKIDAGFRITNWNQPYREGSKDWNDVEIHYEIRNTGGVTIGYYKILFEVTCEDGSKYYESIEKKYQSLYTGEVKSDYTSINTGGKKAVSAEIGNWWISTSKTGYEGK